MNRFNRSTLFLAAAMLAAPGMSRAADAVEVDLNAAAREYCHVLRFPSSWQMPNRVDDAGQIFARYGLDTGDYEFRVPGLQGTKFLVRGVERILSKNYYSIGLYEADLSDATAVAKPATEEEWKSATVVVSPSDVPRSANGARVTDRQSKYAELEGRRFMRSGDAWGSARLSPGRAVLVVESWSGTLTRCGGSDVPGGITPCIDLIGSRGKLFFDVYNTDTGKKAITLTAKFSHILPAYDFEKTGWVTERYFIIPLDDKLERCLICEFGRAR
jgi:hypothetical protein